MAIEVGTAYLSILPSTTKIAPEVRKALGSVEDDAAKAGDRAGSKFAAKFGASFKRLAVGGLLAGVAGGSLLGGLGLKTAAEMENAEIAFTTMLGSAAKAKSFIGELSKFAAKTPFEFPGLQTAASSLISAGINAKDVIPIMTSLGNATSGMGTGSEGIARATVALQQMSAAGRITGEDLNQLRDAGIPVFDLLAAATGKSKKEVAALAQAGKLGSKELGQMMEALKSGKGLERFNGLMEKQSASLGGQFSTLKDTLSMGLAEAVKPLLPLVKQGLAVAAEALGPALDKVAAGAQKAAEWIGKFAKEWQAGEGVGGRFRDVVEATGSAIGALVSVGLTVLKWARDHKPIVIALVGAYVALRLAVIAHTIAQKAAAAGGMLKYLVGILKSTTLISAATKTWAAVQWLLNLAMSANPVGLIVIGIAALIAVVVLIATKTTWFQDLWHACWGAIKTAFNATLGFIKKHWPLILAILTGPIGIAVLVIAKNWDKIKAGAGAVKDFVVRKFGDLIGFFKSLPGKISSATSGMFNGIKEAFRSAINWIIGKWNGLSLSIPSIDTKIPGIGKIGGFSLDTPNIQEFARGGVVGSATLGVFGEAGTEALVPLDKPLSQIDPSVRPLAAFARGLTPPATGAGTGTPTRPVEINVHGDTNPNLTAARVARRLSMLGA